ncbi:MAG: hypothetical protein FWH01_12165 [Oscillospiraceae bacterium]|nr:hypothetical protein [Oscillospiraceae bacterium]
MQPTAPVAPYAPATPAAPVAPAAYTAPAAPVAPVPPVTDAATAPHPNEAALAKPKRKMLPFIILAAAAAVLVITVVGVLMWTGVISISFFGAPASAAGTYAQNEQYVAYIKDGELHIAHAKSQASFEATSDLLSGETFRNSMISNIYVASNLVQMTKNGSRLFYPDRIISDGSYNLFTRTVSGNGKTTGEAVRLDTDIRGGYRVSEDGKNAFYVRGDAKSLYSHNMKERSERIASDVEGFIINGNGTRIYYSDSEANIYYKNRNAATEKVDSESTFIGTSPDFATVYYTKDGTLYRKKQGETKERISAGVSSVIMLYDSGELYYTKETDTDDKTIDVLCYYDGTSETRIGSTTDFNYSLAIGSTKPVLVYSINTDDKEESEYRIAVKAKDTAIDVSKTFRFPRLNPSATKLYYIDDYNENRNSGDLWSADVTDDGLKQAAQLYEDVNIYRINSKGAVHHYSELNRAGTAADLYLEGKTVDTDVLINSEVEIGNTGNLLYYTDYNSNRDRGTLNISVNGKPAMIADDVSMFAPLGGTVAVYLIVEGSANTGDIYCYDGSKDRKRIDTDVAMLMPIYLTGSGGVVSASSYNW